MSMMKHLVAPVMLALVSQVQADTLITVTEGSGMAQNSGDPDKRPVGKTVQIWSKPDEMVRVLDGGRMIFSENRKMTLIINDAEKTCRGLPHPKSNGLDSTANPIPDAQKTGDNRKVGPWDTEGYELHVKPEGMDETINVKFWVADGLTTGLDVFRANFERMMTPQTAWVTRTMELGGYPVYQETRIGAMLTWSEITSVKDEPAPDGMYEAPAGYTGCAGADSGGQ